MTRFARGIVLAAAALSVIGCGRGSEGQNEFFETPPVLQADTFEALGGSTVTVDNTRGILTNDILNGVAFVGGNFITTGNGQFNLANDGSFAYTPAAGFSGTDTFTYNVGNSTAAVTFRVTRRAIFVRNDAAAGGNGTQVAPFDTLAAALTAADRDGDIIFIFRGVGTTAHAGNIVIPRQGQSLVGEGDGLATAQGVVVAPGDFPVVDQRIVANFDDIVVAGIRSEGAAGGLTATDCSGLTVRNNQFVNPIGVSDSLSLSNLSGAIRVTNNLFRHNATSGTAVSAVQNTGAGQFTVSNNAFAATANNSGSAVVLDLSGTASVTLTAQNNAGTGPDAGQGFRDGYLLVAQGSSRIAATIASNSLNGAQGSGLGIITTGTAEVSGTIASNNFTNLGSRGVVTEALAASTQTLTVRNNTLGGGLDSFFGNFGTGTALFGLRNNIFQNNTSVARDVQVQNSSTGTVGLDFTGNTLVTLALLNLAGVFNVEDFGVAGAGLLALNTLTAVTVAGLEDITPVANDSLLIP